MLGSGLALLGIVVMIGIVAEDCKGLTMLRYFSLPHIQPSKINFRVKKFPSDIFVFVEFQFRICNQNFLTLAKFGDMVRSNL